MFHPRCKGCYYAGSRSCNYYLITGIRNPGKPEDCDKYREGKRIGKLPKNFVKSSAYISTKDANHNGFWESMEQLYNEGLNDKQIAEDLGCSPGAVTRWRANHCLPSQREIERMRKNGSS